MKFDIFAEAAGNTSYCVDINGAPYCDRVSVPVSGGPGDTAVANPVLQFGNDPVEKSWRDAFDAFTTIYTYVTFMGNLGIHGKPLTVVLSRSLTQTGFNAATNTIDLVPSDFEDDGKWLGHELGHWAAYSAGWCVDADCGGGHWAFQNQRFAAQPNPTDYITAADQEFSFDEGFADWFGTSGAYNTTNVAVLSPLPGFASGARRTLGFWDLTRAWRQR